MARLFMCDMCGTTVRADKYVQTYLPVIVEKNGTRLWDIQQSDLCFMCAETVFKATQRGKYSVVEHDQVKRPYNKRKKKEGE